jgi:hypothetical protein
MVVNDFMNITQIGDQITTIGDKVEDVELVNVVLMKYP